MSRRAVLFVHLGLMLAAAVLAWVAYSRPESDKPQGRILVDVKPAEISRLVYESEKKKVEVIPRPGGGLTLNVQETVTPPPKATEVNKPSPEGREAKPPESPEAERKPEVRRDSYRASQEFERELERLMPLYVEREIQVAAADMEKFGLGESRRRLSLSSGSLSVEFALGGQTYGGSTQYLLRLPDGPVFLVSTALERAFDIRAPRYLERRLIETSRSEIDAVLVGDGTGRKSRRLLRQKKESADVWVTEDQPQVVNTLAGTWMGKVMLLGAEAYLAEAPRPEPMLKARLLFFRDGKAQDELVLAAGTDEKGAETFFARSKFTGQWVRLSASSARDAIADLPAVLGGE